MNKSVTQINCHAALFLNGAMIWKSNEPAHLAVHAMSAMRELSKQQLEPRDLSTAEFRFSKRPISSTSEPDPYEGLDMTGVIMEGSDEYHKLLAETNIDDLMIQAKARESDPLYMEYMSINSAKTAAETSPQTLMSLRNHMRVNYPDVPLRW